MCLFDVGCEMACLTLWKICETGNSEILILRCKNGLTSKKESFAKLWPCQVSKSQNKSTIVTYWIAGGYFITVSQKTHFEDTQLPHSETTRWLTLWAFCELSLNLQLTSWACCELFMSTLLTVANSQKAHSKLRVWAHLVTSLWAECP